MKKSILLVAVATLCAVMAYAQPRAIGARLGWDPQFSYEHTLGKNMLSIDAGAFYNFHGAQAAVTYDFINPFGASFDNVWDGKGEWNWYLGIGAGAGISFWSNNSASAAGVSANYHETYSYVGAAARVGVEYNFWFPLQLSIDYRPVFGPGFYTTSTSAGGSKSTSTDVYFHGAYGDNAYAIWAGGIALSVRYRFGK